MDASIKYSQSLAGAGQFSLDYLLGLDLVLSKTAALLALAIGLLGALGNLAVRDLPKAATRPS